MKNTGLKISRIAGNTYPNLNTEKLLDVNIYSTHINYDLLVKLDNKVLSTLPKSEYIVE